MSQAIQTKYLGKNRIRVTCRRASTTVVCSAGDTDEGHAGAVEALCGRFLDEDEAQRGEPRQKNPWAKPFVTGRLKDQSCVHVFLP